MILSRISFGNLALHRSLGNEPEAKESEKSINQGQKTLSMVEKSPAMPGIVFLKN